MRAWPGSGENPPPGADSCLLTVWLQPFLGAGLGELSLSLLCKDTTPVGLGPHPFDLI